MQDEKLSAQTAEPHSLLNASSDIKLPTVEEIEAAGTEEEVFNILDRIEHVRDLHADNLDVYTQTRELEEQAVMHLYRLGRANPGQETENAGE